MIVLRIIGFTMIAIGLVFCITVIGAPVGVPMMLFGLLFVLVGRKRTPIVIQVQQDPASAKTGFSGSEPTAMNSSATPRSTTAARSPMEANTPLAEAGPHKERWLASAVLPDGQIKKFDISKDEPCRIIGRDPKTADIIFTDNSISRPHARIDLKNGLLWIRDLGSSNGTKVNGHRVRGNNPVQLRPSDRIQLGEVILTISIA